MVRPKASPLERSEDIWRTVFLDAVRALVADEGRGQYSSYIAQKAATLADECLAEYRARWSLAARAARKEAV